MKRPALGSIVIAFLALLPVGLWCMFGWRQPNLNVLGKWAGLVGLSLLSINIILSSRLIIFNKLFHGLDRMYRVHHMVGCLTLIALLLHANLLILFYANISIETGFSFLTDMNPALVAGRLGLLIMISAMIVVLYFKVKYQWFITAQRILGGVIFLGGYHALFVPGSDIRRIPPLFVYMTTLGAIAGSIYVYRSIFHKSVNRTYPHKVTEVRKRGSVTSITLKPTDRSLQHYAGQFAFVSFKSRHVPDEIHPFTISSGSNAKRLEFNIKNIGDYTAKIQNLREGDKAVIEGPHGEFSFTKIGGAHQTWIAGGIGITPFLSMARSLPPNLKVDLYYSVKQAEEAIFLPELEEIMRKNKHFRVFSVYTDTDGFLTAKKIKAHSGFGQNILLCGPPPMMKAIEHQLIDIGIKKHNIYYEEFRLS